MNDNVLLTFALAKLKSDSVVASLMGIGVDARDPRIFFYYQANAEISETKPSYATYTILNESYKNGAIRSCVVSFQIWTRKIEYASLVAQAFEDVWDNKGYNDSSDEIIFGACVHRNDIFQEQPNFSGKARHFQFSYLELKPKRIIRT